MTETAKARRFVIGIQLQRPRSWRDDAYNLADFDAWDRAQRRKLGWRAGLAFWTKTNVPGSRVLISRHWPHLLCWSWAVWVGGHRKGFDGPRRFILQVSRPYRMVHLNLFGPSIRLSWQDYGHMAALGPDGERAPRVLWNHHLKNMPAAGSA